MENISLTVAVPPQKLTKIIDQIRTIQGSSRLTQRDLQSLVGRLFVANIRLALPATTAYTAV